MDKQWLCCLCSFWWGSKKIIFSCAGKMDCSNPKPEGIAKYPWSVGLAWVPCAN